MPAKDKDAVVCPPPRLVRAMSPDVEVDTEKRILRRAVFVTRNIASDGGIVMPDGIVVRFWEQDPIVLVMHGRFEGKFPVAGRSLGLTATRQGMESVTQFADTELGREIAYLYGVNAEREVYARGWSFGWRTLEQEAWNLKRAKDWLGPDWDEDLIPPAARRFDEVWVAVRSIMNEYSAVPLGADRKALSRAFNDKNIRTAGEWITSLDLEAAGATLEEIKREQETDRARIEKLESDIQALRGEGASAAARGDSEAIRCTISAMLDDIRKRN